jgi:hypothetical protein
MYDDEELPNQIEDRNELQPDEPGRHRAALHGTLAQSPMEREKIQYRRQQGDEKYGEQDAQDAAHREQLREAHGRLLSRLKPHSQSRSDAVAPIDALIPHGGWALNDNFLPGMKAAYRAGTAKENAAGRARRPAACGDTNSNDGSVFL